MSVTVCVAPARTLAYPKGGGHLWVYLHWALALRALGCLVIWLEVLDPRKPMEATRSNVTALRARLDRFGLAESLALSTPDGGPLPRDLAASIPDLEAASEADLLLNLWHSLPEAVVRRFRRSSLVDTDPGLLQVWMTLGSVHVAPHDLYFTIG